MKILITGTKGFIGSNLLMELQKKEKNSFLKINEDFLGSENWQTKLINKLNKFAPKVVFHVGACSDTLETNVQYMMTTNFEFTKCLVDWCVQNKVPIIYSSSAANYGSDGKLPSNLYAWSKYTAECYVNSNGGISLRYFNVYGPKEQHKGKMSSVIYQTITHKKTSTEDFKLFPKKPLRDFVYVDDVVNANIYAFKNYKKLKGDFYDVGSGNAEPFEKILEIVGINYHYYDKNQIPDGYQFYTCSNKKKWMTGWTPKFDLEAGINRYTNLI